MKNLQQTKCFNHEAREAIARCPECGHFFCRECITEHGGRVLCSACIRNTHLSKEETRSGAFFSIWRACAGVGRLFIGLLILWIFFYAVGQLLLLIPDSFHSGEFWRLI